MKCPDGDHELETENYGDRMFWQGGAFRRIETRTCCTLPPSPQQLADEAEQMWINRHTRLAKEGL